MKMNEAPQQENTESIKYHLKLARELSTLFAKIQDEGSADGNISEILEKYNAINVYAEEGSMSESDPVDSNNALDAVETRDEILELIRPIEAFLRTRGVIK